MTIGRTDNQEFLPGTGEHTLYPNTTYAMEYSVSGEVTEWGNKSVSTGFEDNVIFDGNNTELVDGYPQQLYLIK
jgi:hypothetical protein